VEGGGTVEDLMRVAARSLTRECRGSRGGGWTLCGVVSTCAFLCLCVFIKTRVPREPGRRLDPVRSGECVCVCMCVCVFVCVKLRASVCVIGTRVDPVWSGECMCV